MLDELNDSEKMALASGQYTTSNLKEVCDLIAQWFTAINTALPEAFAVSATALAVYEANYMVKLYGGKIKNQMVKSYMQQLKNTIGRWGSC